jgi:hypothetical protein
MCREVALLHQHLEGWAGGQCGGQPEPATSAPGVGRRAGWGIQLPTGAAPCGLGSTAVQVWYGPASGRRARQRQRCVCTAAVPPLHPVCAHRAKAVGSCHQPQQPAGGVRVRSAASRPVLGGCGGDGHVCRCGVCRVQHGGQCAAVCHCSRPLPGVACRLDRGTHTSVLTWHTVAQTRRSGETTSVFKVAGSGPSHHSMCSSASGCLCS